MGCCNESIRPSRRHQSISWISPFDRGAADSYYRRGRVPHKMVGKTIIWLKPDSQEWLEYQEGYDINEEIGSFKEYE
jgi:hypothetical protein